MAQSQTPTDFILWSDQPVALGKPKRAGVARRWLSIIAEAWREGIEMYARGGTRRGFPGWFG